MNQKGIILVPVIIMLSVLAVVTYLMAEYANHKLNLTSQNHQNTQARYVLEAGLQHAKHELTTSSCSGYSDKTNIALEENSYNIKFSHLPTDNTTTTLTADKDTRISEENPTISYSNDSSLYVSNRENSRDYTFLNFNISSLNSSDEIQSAILNIYLNNHNQKTGISVHQATKDWSNSNAKWSTRNSDYNPTPITSIEAQSNGSHWISFNVTELVNAWHKGSTDNYGFVLIPTSGNAAEIFDSRENSSGNAPNLKIISSPTTIEPFDITIEASVSNHSVTNVYPNQSAYPAIPTRKIISLVSNNPTLDTTIDESDNYAINGNDTNLLVANNQSSEKRILFYLNPSSVFNLHKDSKIIKVELGLHLLSGSTNTGALVEAHEVTKPWSYFSGLGANWKNYKLSTPWDSNGGDFNSEIISNINIPSGSLTADYGSGWYYFDLSSMYQQWKRYPSNYNGIIIKTNTDNVTELEFASTNNSDPTIRPQLVITYLCPCGMSCEY